MAAIWAGTHFEGCQVDFVQRAVHRWGHLMRHFDVDGDFYRNATLARRLQVCEGRRLMHIEVCGRE
ncbi:hypothetical protein TcasGA2_TC033191 [Tribolium castaneum]|uniref:Uncharacterized protein n=1 Tax=Tribolium castaneum TaxID=7070 RepID=A0A139WHS9_TRICA|nr:hypothetical protein TcasGA2_TC033191 [Tribolium castaneum]